MSRDFYDVICTRDGFRAALHLCVGNDQMVLGVGPSFPTREEAEDHCITLSRRDAKPVAKPMEPDEQTGKQTVVCSRLANEKPWVGLLEEWAADNQDLQDLVNTLERLPPGETVEGGGGAAPRFSVTVVWRGELPAELELFFEGSTVNLRWRGDLPPPEWFVAMAAMRGEVA